MRTEYLSKKTGRALLGNKMTLAVAESCTGGMLGSAITAIPGASRFFLGGVIAYDNRIKRKVLGVRGITLERHGAVSRQTVLEMAAGVKRLFKADCSIAVSGIAGPGGGTDKKPTGLVYIAVIVKTAGKAFEYRFKGPRDRVRKEAVSEALSLLFRLL